MTARDVIAAFIFERYVGSRQQVDEETDAFLAALLSAPESVRQELAALLNPWRPIETAPSDDPFESIPVPLETRELGVTISRAQHEALMAAAKSELEDCDGIHQRAQIAERRVRELEADRDASRSETERLTNLCAEARADRDSIRSKTFKDCEPIVDAIRAKTIEECAACAMRLPYGNHVAMHIRALAQKDKATSLP